MKPNVVDTVVVIRPGTKLALEVAFGGPLGEFLANETGAILKGVSLSGESESIKKKLREGWNVVRPDGSTNHDSDVRRLSSPTFSYPLRHIYPPIVAQDRQLVAAETSWPSFSYGFVVRADLEYCQSA